MHHKTRTLIEGIPNVAVKYWAIEAKTKWFLLLLFLMAFVCFAGGWIASVDFASKRLKTQDTEINDLRIEVDYMRSHNPKSAQKFDKIYRKK